jgi:hypothetical protein
MARTFYATMSYELSPATTPEARKLLRAELVGRKWNDRYKTALMPASTLWILRAVGEDDTTDEVHAACVQDLREAAQAVAQRGLPIQVVRAWLHIAGGGAFALATPEELGVGSQDKA